MGMIRNMKCEHSDTLHFALMDACSCKVLSLNVTWRTGDGCWTEPKNMPVVARRQMQYPCFLSKIRGGIHGRNGAGTVIHDYTSYGGL